MLSLESYQQCQAEQRGKFEVQTPIRTFLRRNTHRPKDKFEKLVKKEISRESRRGYM